MQSKWPGDKQVYHQFDRATARQTKNGYSGTGCSSDRTAYAGQLGAE